ncbi:glutamyl-tRNA(Gln) amidotransferase subunit A, mitochondrial [Arctopsyche grandis]|uniref:glutamyl-tRNA(Gln) amidotransferase subunit A, mitochondrial n=1 Tax=Arctopsyche grandis TaxID=121162 RepID=UPI00406D706D
MDKLLSLSIRAVQKKFQDGSLSPSELMKLSLKRVEDVQHLNAFITLLPTAQHTADELQKDPTKPLNGIPIAVKDNFCTLNAKTTCASKMLENFTPMYDATVVSKLKKSGAVIVGKTNLDQFAMGSGTVDSVYGPTRNIWGSEFNVGYESKDGDDFRIAGGSSGGSAVAVASGVCLAGIGSDTGGSTRNPAALCGLVGFKPTYGMVSRHGLIPLVNSMDVPGILTRNVDDCISIFNCIAGPDSFDSTTLKDEFQTVNVNDVDLKSVRIGIPEEYRCEGLSPEVLDTWMEVVDLLENEGAYVKIVSMPYTSASIAVYSILNQCEVASNMARYDGLEYGYRAEGCSSTNELYAKSRAEGFNDVVRNRILAGNYFLLTQNYDDYFMKAMKIRRLIKDDFDRVFGRCDDKECVDLLLTPTTLSDAPLYSDFVRLDNRDQCAVHDFCTQPANMAGVPAISLPIKLSNRKLPLSLQLMGPNCSESLLFGVAKKIESLVKFPMLDFKL